MYCPQCKSEFESWVSKCPDCDVALVPELPPDLEHDALEVRSLLETSDPDLLPVLLGALRAAGIPYWTPGEATLDLWPIGQTDHGEASSLISTSVMVPADRYEEALAILETEALVVDDVASELELAPHQQGEDEDEEDGEVPLP